MGIGAPLTRGGLTFSDGAAITPAVSNSLTSYGRSADVSFIGRARANGTTLTTNSLVAATLISVSFLLPSRRLTGQKSTVGGLAPTPLKKLNGARFGMPLGEIVDTQAIGRGVMQEIMTR